MSMFTAACGYAPVQWGRGALCVARDYRSWTTTTLTLHCTVHTMARGVRPPARPPGAPAEQLAVAWPLHGWTVMSLQGH